MYTNEGIKVKKEHMRKILEELEKHQGYELTNGQYFDSEEFDYDNACDVSVIWEERLDRKGKYKIIDDDDFYYIFSRISFQIVDFLTEKKNIIADVLMEYVEDDIPLYEDVLEMMEYLD